MTVLARNLEERWQPFQLRMADEHLELVAEHSFTDVGVTVSVRSERRGSVVKAFIVLQPGPEELMSHEQYLDAMEKEARGPSLWRRILDSA